MRLSGRVAFFMTSERRPHGLKGSLETKKCEVRLSAHSGEFTVPAVRIAALKLLSDK